jgi:hypothetical protein
MAKKVLINSVNFTQIEINLLIRASEHLQDAYSSSSSPGDKATVTNLQKIRDRLSKVSTDFINASKSA